MFWRLWVIKQLLVHIEFDRKKQTMQVAVVLSQHDDVEHSAQGMVHVLNVIMPDLGQHWCFHTVVLWYCHEFLGELSL